MNAKANIQALPNANDRLRAALAERDNLGAKSTEIIKKIERLAPLEAEVAMAGADLQKILAADTEALHDWVRREARGTPPDVNAKAREDAARKLASAQTRLGAAAGVKRELEQELVEINQKLSAHKGAVDLAIVDVFGEEALREVQEMRETAAVYLECEQRYLRVMARLRTFMSINDAQGNTSAASVKVGVWLDRIAAANTLTNEERSEVVQRAAVKSEERLQALLSGEDPVR